ncbi:hypothetical protein BRC81_05925 [Halobacteriales archaeon QS_1_68_20]|nr:MAG: hypothetical protein BRC81_05925 [Halobacteriales archaeon QS_1_68_20]
MAPPDYWLFVVFAVPVVEGVFFTVVTVGGQHLGYEYDPEHQYLIHVVYVYAAVAVLVGVAGLDPHLAFAWPYLAALLLGAAMYHVDTFAWTRATGTEANYGGQSLLATAPAVLSAPAEEIVFRAGLAPLIDAWGPVAFVVASAGLFGAVHIIQRPREVVLKSINGVVYCALFLATGSVVAPALAHLGHNAAYVRVATGASSGAQWTQG